MTPSADAQHSGTSIVPLHQAAMLGWMQELAPYGIFTTDTSFKIRSWNEWLETHSGLAAPLVIGRNLFEVFPDLRTRKLDEHFRRAMLGEIIVLSTAFHGFLLPFQPTVRESGYGQMQQTARIAPLTIEDSICGTITIIEDVTQREAQSLMLARKHERDQLVSSALAHLLRTRDPDTMVRELFPRMSEFVHVDACLHHMVDPSDGSIRLHGATGISETERREMESPRPQDSLGGVVAAQRASVLVSDLQTTTDERFARERAMGFLALVGYPLLVGSRLIGTLTFGSRLHSSFTPEDLDLLAALVQYVAIALDRAVTETALHRAEKELREHAEDLEAKVRERTARLQDTVVQLESFSYTVAHDLRAPIRALKGYAQVLLDDTGNEASLPPTARQYLMRIERAASRLEAITRDLLQFSTISRQDVTLASVDVAELLRDLQLLRPALNEEVLEVKQPLHGVLAHRTLLQHCLSNLLDNAIKFVRPGTQPKIVVSSELIHARLLPPRQLAYNLKLGGEPDVSTDASSGSSADDRSKWVRIWVEDNGIGVPPDSQNKIFGIFERLHSAEKYEGTGIGLAIVARAMERMGGSCGVESAAGMGSRFWLVLRSGAS